MEANEHERKWYLAAKILTNAQLDAEEASEWKTLEGDEEFQREFELVKQHLSQVDTLPYHSIDVEKDWTLVWDRIRDHVGSRQKRSVFPALKYAAVIVFCVAVSFILGRMYNERVFDSGSMPKLTTITAPPGSKTAVTLPDSSRVWLNAQSTLSFDEDFAIDNRAVKLEGEAFFDVEENDIPFTVQTDLFKISVLGTAFNVKTYKDDDKMITTLVRGSLKVTQQDGREVLLRPNEKLTVTRVTGTASGTFVHQKGIDAEMETAWKDGWLSVQGESLSELAKKIERLYDIRIHFRDKGLENFRYSGRLRQFSLEQVLKALSLTSPVAFSIDEKNVTLWENEAAKSKYRSLQTP